MSGVILVRIFPAFSRIRTEYGEIPHLSVFIPNAGKMRIRITPNTDTFHAVYYRKRSASRIKKKSYWRRSYNCINSSEDFCILMTSLLVDTIRNELISNRSVSSSACCSGIVAKFAILIPANLNGLIEFYSPLGFLILISLNLLNISRKIWQRALKKW